jgi:hypothetical protein
MAKNLDYKPILKVLHEVGNSLLKCHEVIVPPNEVKGAILVKLQGQKYGEQLVIAFPISDLLEWQHKNILKEEIMNAVQVVIDNLIIRADDDNVENTTNYSLILALGIMDLRMNQHSLN